MVANRQSPLAQFIGLPPSSPVLTTVQTMSSGGSWTAYSLVPIANGTLNMIRAYNSLVNNSGTPGITASSIMCEIQTDTSGYPSLVNPAGGAAVSCTAVPVVGFNTWSGLSCIMSAGTPYWVVWKNIDANPNLNYVRFSTLSIFGNPAVGGNSLSYQTTTNSGTTWTPAASQVPANMRMGWSDGTYQGALFSNTTSIAVDAQGSTEVGAKGTLPGPSSLTYNVAGIALSINKHSPNAAGTNISGNAQFRLYLGNSTTPTATTFARPLCDVSGAEYHTLYFVSSSGTANPQGIPGGQTFRITVSDTFNDTSGGYRIQPGLLTDVDANTIPLLPLQGTWMMTTLSGGAWIDNSGTLPLGGLVLDSTGEFSVTATGGGIPVILPTTLI